MYKDHNQLVSNTVDFHSEFMHLFSPLICASASLCVQAANPTLFTSSDAVSKTLYFGPNVVQMIRRNASRVPSVAQPFFCDSVLQ